MKFLILALLFWMTQIEFKVTSSADVKDGEKGPSKLELFADDKLPMFAVKTADLSILNSELIQKKIKNSSESYKSHLIELAFMNTNPKFIIELMKILEGDAFDLESNEFVLTAAGYACLGGCTDILEWLDLDFKVEESSITLMHCACSYKDCKVVNWLIEREYYKVNAENISKKKTALHYACKSGNFEAVKLLIDKGYDYTGLDDKGRTVAHFACMSGNLGLVKYLLKLSPSFIEKLDNENMSILHMACQTANKELIIHLITEHKMDISAVDNFGRNALHIFCLRDNFKDDEDKGLKIVEILKGKYSIKEQLDNDNRSPLDLCKLVGNENVWRFLSQIS